MEIALLVKYEGKCRREIFVLTKEKLVIGRSGAGYNLNDELCSRRHCALYLNGKGEMLVQDLDSKNGTFLANAAVRAPRRLRDGDIIHLGPVELRFRIWAEGGAETERIARR